MDHKVLADYAVFSGSFTTQAEQGLQNLQLSIDHKFTYTLQDHYTCYYWIEDGFVYLVVADDREEDGRLLAYAFLERVKMDFQLRYGGRNAHDIAVAHSLDRDFGCKLKEHMQCSVDHPQEMSDT